MRYEHDGRVWRQRHQYGLLAPEVVVLVTAQSPESEVGGLFDLAGEIARSLADLHPADGAARV